MTKKVFQKETVYCPYCGAYNHPYTLEEVHEDGTVDPPKPELYCKACNRDMLPMIDAMKQYIKDYVDFKKDKDVKPIERKLTAHEVAVIEDNKEKKDKK